MRTYYTVGDFLIESLSIPWYSVVTKSEHKHSGHLYFLIILLVLSYLLKIYAVFLLSTQATCRHLIKRLKEEYS